MLLEATNLCKAYGGVTAVDGVSFSVLKREILGLIGANGSGKTTCLNILTRVVDTSGSMRFENKEYSKLPSHRIAEIGISRTFQNLRLFKDLTVRENVALGAQARRPRLSEKEISTEVQALLDRARIGAYAESLPVYLPYGTQRVVEIARALATQPKLVFLDEPFAGMSSEEAASICEFLLDVRKTRDMALVIVDHNVEVLSAFVERLVVLAEGHVICQGAVASVLAHPDVIRSYVGADD